MVAADHRQDQGGPDGQAEGDQKGVTQIPADHDEMSLGDVEGIGALENDDKTDGDQGIDHAQGKAGYR